MANKPDNANFFPDVPKFPSMGTFQPVYGKFDLTTYIQGASDYEIMAFLVGKYNACLEAYGTVTKLSTDTIKAANQLQEWVNEWFTNLDVQTELNNKIDNMVESGTFSSLLKKTFENEILETTSDTVTKWLVANVTPSGSAVIVDKSLTVAGAAADSKVVGDIILPIKGTSYFDSSNVVYSPVYISKTGVDIEFAKKNYYTSTYIPITEGLELQYSGAGIGAAAYAVAFYDESKQLIEDGSIFPDSPSGIIIAMLGKITAPANAKYVRYSYSPDVAPIHYLTFITSSNIIPNIVDKVNNVYSTLFDISYTGVTALYSGMYLGKNGFVPDSRTFISQPVTVVPGVPFNYTIRAIADLQYAIIAVDLHGNILFDQCVTPTGTPGSTLSYSGTYTPSIQCAKLYFSWYLEVPNLNVPTYTPKTENIKGTWFGKKWAAFGTSITDTRTPGPESGKPSGRYIPYLRTLSTANIIDYGAAGGRLCNYGIDGNNTGNGVILDKILSTDLSNFDIITIEGFVNDYAASITLGKLGDTGNTTFYGCLYQAINYAQSNSHGLVALISDTTGKKTSNPNFVYTAKNKAGLTQRDYNEAMKKFAEYSGCVFIDAGQTSEINMNNPQYLYDHIHQTDKGGEQYANAIWNEIKNLTPNIK